MRIIGQNISINEEKEKTNIFEYWINMFNKVKLGGKKNQEE